MERTFVNLHAQKAKKEPPKEEKPEPKALSNISLSGLSFRNIGPAVTGGRIIGIDVNPIIVRYEAQGRTSLKDKVKLMTQSLWSTTSGPTGTFERALPGGKRSLRPHHERIERRRRPDRQAGADAGRGGSAVYAGEDAKVVERKIKRRSRAPLYFFYSAWPMCFK